MKLITLLAAIALSTPAMSQTNMEVVCSYVPSQSKSVAAISSAAGGAAAATSAVASAAGLTVVAHSSGAAILTGSSGYIAGTIGGAAALPAVVTVGVVVAGAAATVELVCAKKNHPEQVEKVYAAATEFGKRFKVAMQAASLRVGDAIKSIKPAAGRAALEAKRVTAEAWQRHVYRPSE